MTTLALLCAMIFGENVFATELGIQNTQFTLDAKPVFLRGMSYYAGLGAREEFVRGDLDDLHRLGFNWIRIWATWPAFDADLAAVDPNTGEPRQPFFDRLKSILTECDTRGIVVDVTLTRGGVGNAARLTSQQQHQCVVVALVTAFRAQRNWYLDLANERNIGDKRHVSFAELAELRAEVKRLDPMRLVTASQGGDISREELREYLQTVHVDFITPHRPRDSDSIARTEPITRELLVWMKAFGTSVPIHFQEPFRRGYDRWQPAAEDFVNDFKAAQAGGAAGWCFHNGSERRAPGEQPRRSFDLRERRLFDQLDAAERRALEEFAKLFREQGK